MHYIRKYYRKFLAGPQWMPEPLFAVRLSRIYRSAIMMAFVWCMGWYERIFSRPARILLIVFIVSALFSMFSVEGTALFIIMSMVSGAVADWIAGTLFMPRLQLIRRLPARAVCGIPFTLSYKIKNKRKYFPALDLLAEPYSMGRDFLRPDGLEYFSLPANGERDVTVRLTPTHRGICPLPCAMVESSFPFNIFKHSQSAGGDREPLLVHPAYRDMKHLLIHSAGHREQRPRNTAHKNQSGESLNFNGCREYQIGDSPRRIHWVASAKRNKLVVKEFQQENMASAAVFLDSGDPITAAGCFTWKRLYKEATRDIASDVKKDAEALISLGASVVYSLISNNVYISHFSWGATVYPCSMNGSPKDHLPRILDTLAVVTPERKNPVPEMMNAVHELRREIEELYLVLLRYDDEIHNWIMSLKANKMHVSCILLTHNPPTDLPREVICIKPGEVFADREDGQ